VRFSALMMPVVIVWSKPNGLPIAIAVWPTLRSPGRADRSGTSPLTLPRSRTPRGRGSATTASTSALPVAAADGDARSCAPSTTWWLVTTMPASSQTKPLPVPDCSCTPKRVRTSAWV
jgi:hypothetical protein